MKVIRDRNAGNGIHTYWKARADREYCIQLDNNDYARDARGRVRRFKDRLTAGKAMDKLIEN